MNFFNTGKILKRLDQMIDGAISGDFEESAYDESQLSKVESKWKHYLAASKMSYQNVIKEKENVKGIISDISHQTKTPITNICLYSELLKKSMKEESCESQEYVDQIMSQTKKLDFLIQALVKMSRLESNMIEIRAVKQPVISLTEEVKNQILGKAMEKEIDISWNCREEIMAVYDLKWTAEALYNILDNGVKYSQQGTKIKVMVREYEMYVCISVEDEGMGISEEEKTNIFKRFYRGVNVQQMEGSGIGLYLTREIIRKQKGYIKVSSKPEKGAVFSMYLPILSKL